MTPRKRIPGINTKDKGVEQPSKTKVQKSTKKTAAKTNAARDQTIERAAVLNTQAYVKRFKNGLVNLTRMPDHLLKKAQRNATESPLLRLPPEIRKKIWTFAVQVDCVQAPIIYCWETRRHQFNKGGAVAVQDNGAIATRHLETDTDNCCPFRQLGAFHLPEVCRQVYIETATLSYSTNIFLVGSESLLCKNWARKEILLAQRDAITKVELGFEILTRHYFSTYVWPASLRRRGFRNLTHVYISCHTRKVSVKKWRRHLYLWELHLKGSKELLTWCEAKLREKEGSDLVVVFEGYSFSGKHDDITPSGDDDDSDELSEESEDDDEGDDDE